MQSLRTPPKTTMEVFKMLPEGTLAEIIKKDVYQKFGVQEYWVVTPATKETIGFILKNGSYTESGRYSGKIHSVMLDNTSFEF